MNAQLWVDTFVDALEKCQWMGQGWVVPYEHPAMPLPDDTSPTERSVPITER